MSSFPRRFLSIGTPRWTLRAAQTLTMAVMVLTILGIGGNPAAAQGTVIRQTTTTSAIAEGEACFTDFEECSLVDLYIGPGKGAGTTVLCLSISTGWTSYEEACADVTATFTMDAKLLTVANLPPTPVTFETANCDKFGNCSDPITRTVTVAASWAGAGNRTPIQEILGDRYGACTEMHVITGMVRHSTVTLTIDGQAVTASGNLQSIDATQTLRTNCDE